MKSEMRQIILSSMVEKFQGETSKQWCICWAATYWALTTGQVWYSGVYKWYLGITQSNDMVLSAPFIGEESETQRWAVWWTRDDPANKDYCWNSNQGPDASKIPAFNIPTPSYPDPQPHFSNCPFVSGHAYAETPWWTVQWSGQHCHLMDERCRSSHFWPFSTPDERLWPEYHSSSWK